MTPAATGPASVSFPALGTTASLLVTDPDAMDAARQVLDSELAAIDAACSRFRTDSELSRANVAAGGAVHTSALFAEALDVALHVAEATEGVVDPTVGTAVSALGYGVTFAALRPQDLGPVSPAGRSPGWRAVEWDRAARRLRLPPGVALDLGATAKALAADRASRRAAEVTGCGVLVNLGGDISVAGRAPLGGWRIAVADDHAVLGTGTLPTVSIAEGGLATSGTTVRTWCRGGRRLHHIVDPATGDIPAPVWRTVSVAAMSCVAANTASTEAVVLGAAALGRLRRTGLPARLVHVDGTVERVCGWPEDNLGDTR
ncbi:FAD:protein FMN transferase [Streptomyces malaysiense]|uniref:FAD:protein FMN transferase n=1 Tax=Streptomyces malaysiense TaxID=1428626 RepID=A0A1J4PVM5_9ACTN|nr:FAD:protein FMN transferase [Streptomyces malaysiense]OIK24023.1 thiamine biosynthesis protein [Streptomyces malaysiense]